MRTMHTSRRRVLTTGALVGAATALPVTGRRDLRATAAAAPLPSYPFRLGVASGDPSPDGFVLWTRLALDPLAADGLGGMPDRSYQVLWQVATDERFTDVVRAGAATAAGTSAHSVHVEVGGLLPGREYFYRFRTGEHVSTVGRALTTPAYDASPAALALGVVSCSNYPAGYFTAYRRMAEERPDLVLHLGDYTYEGAGSGIGRTHAGPETRTLAGYRQRHAQYKTDADLQVAHAAAPWLVVWDDHEVENNYADDIAERVADQPTFLARRAAAYQAYYENMPLRRTSVPRGPDLDLYRRVRWGQLANLHLLDTRQYRSDQACGDGYKDCPDAADPARSLPGAEQEAWLLDGFRQSRARWDVLGQQVFFGRRDSDPGDGTRVSMDAWDGYPASRRRITEGWVEADVRNPVVLTGDVHAHWASDVLRDFDDPASEVVGAEFVTSSISSGGNGYDQPDGRHPWAEWNPNLRFWTNLRGWLSISVTPDAMTTDYRCVPVVSTPDAEAFTRATFVVEDGVRRMVQTVDAPSVSALRRTPRTDAEIIEDTIRTETGGS
jgi:alkaline phosphatase D